MEWTDWLPTIVVANAIVTFGLWRTAAKLSRTAVRKPPQPKKAFLSTLQSKPIEPKRVKQNPLPNYAGDTAKQLCRDFADFGAVVNWWLSDEHVGSRWRLQELPDAELRLGGIDGPSFGHSFDVFYNQARLGRLEVTDAYGYSASEPKVRTTIELSNVRLLSFDAVQNFLLHIALHVTDTDQGAAEYLRTRQEIERAMTRAVWGTIHISGFDDLDGQDWGELELTLEGTARWYVRRRDCEGFRQLKRRAA
jgi:hypothetical protein